MTKIILPEEQDNLVWHEFSTRDQCARQLADDVAAWLEHAIEERGKASLVVSGGSTPVPFFEALREKELNWNKIWITLADERWVSPDSNDSNELLVSEHLLHAETNFVPLKSAHDSANEGRHDTEEAIKAVPRPFDVVVLGMGPDGHTASLFPQHPDLETALESELTVLPVHNSPKPPPDRMTMTVPAIRDARQLVLHISGNDKLDVLQRALDGGDTRELPIRNFLCQQEVELAMYWAE